MNDDTLLLTFFKMKNIHKNVQLIHIFCNFATLLKANSIYIFDYQSISTV